MYKNAGGELCLRPPSQHLRLRRGLFAPAPAAIAASTGVAAARIAVAAAGVAPVAAATAVAVRAATAVEIAATTAREAREVAARGAAVVVGARKQVGDDVGLKEAAAVGTIGVVAAMLIRYAVARGCTFLLRGVPSPLQGHT